MQEHSSMQVRLVIEFTLTADQPEESRRQIEAFTHALQRELEAERFGSLQQSQATPGTITALIEPPTRIGRALEIARSLLKRHKLKRCSSLSFEKV